MKRLKQLITGFSILAGFTTAFGVSAEEITVATVNNTRSLDKV